MNMILKMILFAFVAIVFSYANVAYGSAVFSGDEDTVDCPYCITPEELEFRNQNPHLFDRIGVKVITYDATKDPNLGNWEISIPILESKSTIEIKTELVK